MKNKNKVILILIFLLIVLEVLFLANYFQKNMRVSKEEIYNTDYLSKSEKEKFKDIVNTGDAYVYYGDHKQAAEEFKKAEELNPVDKQTLYRLSSAQYNAKQYEEAEKTFAKLEESEKQDANYWYLRALNLKNIPTNLDNINRAVAYIEKSFELATFFDAYLSHQTKAEIYFEKYKYYRAKRSEFDNISREEMFAKEKFFEALADINRIAVKNNDNFIRDIYDELYNEFQAFPDGVYKSKYTKELMPVEYTEEDIERYKKKNPQDNYPIKK